jgi:hypothetical protein
MGLKAGIAAFIAQALCLGSMLSCSQVSADSQASAHVFGGPLAGEASAQSLSSRVVLVELKQVGMDPLRAGAKSGIGEAYAHYDLIVGPGHNIQDPAAKYAADNLSKQMSVSGIRSTVRALTPTPGARIRYRLVTEQNPSSFAQLSNNASASLPIGIYHFWAERNGVPTSDQSETFRVILPEVTIDIEERGQGE